MTTITAPASAASLRVAVGSHAPDTAAVRQAKAAFRGYAAAAIQGETGALHEARTALPAAFTDEIRRRGGRTTLITDAYGYGWYTREYSLGVRDADPRRGLAVLHAEGWHQRRAHYPARLVSLTYLVGLDDSGLWATRIPGTVETVDAALAAITPAAATGRETRRQGDILLVRLETARATTQSGVILGSHIWDAETRTLTHSPEDGRAHRPVTVPAEWPGVKLVPQTRYTHLRAPARD